ncbi:MAG: 50S ribosomal protein L21 [Gammaproteobacteria bacterium]|nr:50S ribosomal protein L21 [Gammaproteobacteria bacterium]
MYAVILSGGKQYRVIEGQTLKLEKLVADEGADINFEQVLMIANGDNIQVGKPYLTGSKVLASVVSHGRRDKIRIVKFRRRKHHKKSMGHRQYYTEVKITQILAG